jgi:general secretion pathway protein F
MPLYEYTALDGKGKRRTGLVDSSTLQAAREKLKDEGFFVVTLEKPVSRSEEKIGSDIALFRRVSKSDVTSITRQLATLLKAGLPLVQALEALSEQLEKPAVRKVLNSVRDRVNEGAAFHEALSEHPSVFPPLYVQMTMAGETGGFLDEIMIRLSETLEKESRLRGRVLAALVYPIIMTVLGFVFLLFLFAFVVPKVVGVFADFGKALPLPTRMLLLMSDFASRYWLWIVIVAVAAIFVYRRISLRLRIATVRMAFILGSLLTGGVPLIKSLEVVSEVMGNRVLSSALDRAVLSVSRGESLADSLRVSGVFPPLVPRVIAVGEESGELAGLLTGVAESYEEEVASNIQAMTAILEPVLILIMAAVVLFVVMGVLLPIFELNQLVRTG